MQIGVAVDFENRWNRLLFWFSFLMAFPSVLILGQNASFIAFIMMVMFLLKHSNIRLIGFSKPPQKLAVFFAIGSILSVVFLPNESSSDAIERSLNVLPNYIYWSILIILLVQHRQLLNLTVVYKAVFAGVLASVIYYLFFQGLYKTLPFFNRQTGNSFAFILIAFSPVALYYLKEKTNRFWSLVFLMLLVLILLRDGRRAGTVLVFLGGMATLYVGYLSWRTVLSLLIAIPLFFILLKSGPVESFILSTSDRVHELIYETEDVLSEDRSYLVRVAMIQKARAIFEKYPLTGIGLNNFSNYEIDFDESFEGAQYVISKKYINRTSAHNSYVSVLAEGGLFLFLPFVLILMIPIYHFIKKFNAIPAFQKPVFYGFVMMTLHLYFIMAIVNVFAWFLIALASALVYRK